MSFFKNAKNRIIAFLVGIVFTAAGAIFIYFEFFGKKTNWYSDTSYFSYAIFFIGIASLLIAFDKKKKTPGQPDDIHSNSPDKDQNTGP